MEESWLHRTYSWLGYPENYIIECFWVFLHETVISGSKSCILQQCNIIKRQDDLSVTSQGVNVNLKK